jgi:hypothetical protein
MEYAVIRYEDYGAFEPSKSFRASPASPRSQDPGDWQIRRAPGSSAMYGSRVNE